MLALEPHFAITPMGFYHHFAREGSLLPVANLRLKSGSALAPFSASNCDIRCRNWLHISHSLGFSLLPKGFCHRNCLLSVVLGDSTSPLELWSSNSFTLSPDGFLGPLRSWNFASDCGSILYICSGATSCVGSDDVMHDSLLPKTCIHSMSSIYAPLPLHCPLRLMNCILLCNSLAFTSLGAYLCNCCSGLSYLSTCVSLTLAFEIGSSYHKSPLPITSASHAFAFGIDDVMYDSLLPKTCTHSMSSTFAPLPLYATCTSRIATGMSSQTSVGIYDSINESLLPFTSTSFALAFILLSGILRPESHEMCH